MGLDPQSLINLFSYYRDAEVRGAALLMKMLNAVRDPEAQVLFTRHLADETRHAWLWTKRIRDEAAWPVPVPDGYQRRLGKALGIPGNLLDLFALTIIVEERAQQRYTEHISSPLADEKTLAVLTVLAQDEKWHISWMDEWLRKTAREQGREQQIEATLARYRRVEQEVFEEMKEMEREWIGFSFSDPQLSVLGAAPEGSAQE